MKKRFVDYPIYAVVEDAEYIVTIMYDSWESDLRDMQDLMGKFLVFPDSRISSKYGERLIPWYIKEENGEEFEVEFSSTDLEKLTDFLRGKELIGVPVGYNQGLYTYPREIVDAVYIFDSPEYESEYSTEQKIQILEGELEEWKALWEGNVFGFSIEKKTKCEHCQQVSLTLEDSCYGFLWLENSIKLEELFKENIPEKYLKAVEAGCHVNLEDIN